MTRFRYRLARLLQRWAWKVDPGTHEVTSYMHMNWPTTQAASSTTTIRYTYPPSRRTR